jgi:hypothetical protein
MDFTTIFKTTLQDFKQMVVYYTGNSKTRESINVQKFIKRNLEDYKEMLEAIVAEQGWAGLPYDTIAIRVLQYVRSIMTYKRDIDNYKTTEYWATIEEILASKRDDCEGGALLVICLCRTAGIPADRIYLQCGDVLNPNTGNLGGHCYVKYKSEEFPYVVYYLDWCFMYNSDYITKDKKAFFEDAQKNQINWDGCNYKTIWFFSNDEQAYIW